MSSKILSLGSMYFQIGSFHFPLNSESMLDREIVGGDYVIDTGGSAVNFVFTCKALGLSPIFIGKRGDDLAGRELEKMFHDADVSLDAIIDPSKQTNLALNFGSDDGKAVMFVSGSANASLTHPEILEKIQKHIVSIDYLYIGGLFKLKALFNELREIVALAHQHNVKIILDHGRVTNIVTEEEKQTIREIIPEIDIYLPSHEELIAVLEVESLEEAVEKVRNMSSRIVVIKNSNKGAIGIQDGKVTKVSAFSVPVLSPVGAGDTFNAGFVSALDSGKTFEEAIRFGCAAAALKISSRKQPMAEDIENLLHGK